MNTTVFALPMMIKSIHQWLASFILKKANQVDNLAHPFSRINQEAKPTASVIEAPQAKAKSTAVLQKPVRVVQIFDLQQSSSNAGRIVISGRMADVCAELDRLAALEAA